MDLKVLKDLSINIINEIRVLALMHIKEEMHTPLILVDRILIANRLSESLTILRTKALDEDSDFELEDDLLIYKGYLVIALDSEI